eukprot:gene16121-18219_t
MKRFMGSIQPLLANDLKAILKGAERKNYQIVDVREKDELELARLPDNNVINLPLSEAGTWTNEILEGEILDKSKPTICLCHHGVRSMRFANFIVTQAQFEEVYNVQGGIHAYATEADSSVGTY